MTTAQSTIAARRPRRDGTGADVSAAKPRSETKNLSDPRGQFGAYLRDWLDRNHKGDEDAIAAKLGVSSRTIRKWCEGSNGPAFADLDRVAIALGFVSWAEVAAKYRSFCKRHGLI
jgi:transcriptional regulator with XRE-family HTH domain